MIEILICTNRKDSNSLKIAEIIKTKLTKESQILDLSSDINWTDFNPNLYGADNRPASVKPLVERINKADGIYVICPEYNGSYPGAVKMFIDHWDYPTSFEKRPVCFLGLGGMFGGLRPVEHIQQVFGYRNAFMYPERIFMQNVWNDISKEGELTNKTTEDLIDLQLTGFVKFIEALKTSGLHCLS